MPTAAENAVTAALDLIARTPGYEETAHQLEVRRERGRLRIDPDLIDRAQATLTGTILLGPESLEGDTLGLAQTLVHEHYHLRQNPFEKTVSFWQGVALRRPVMRRYERPAYEAALRFLEAVARAFPDLAGKARREAEEIRATFEVHYGGTLGPV